MIQHRWGESPPLNEQETQASVPDQQPSGSEDGQAADVAPEREDVEAETAQYRAAGDFDVQTVFLVHQAEVPDFVYDQAFECEVVD